MAAPTLALVGPSALRARAPVAGTARVFTAFIALVPLWWALGLNAIVWPTLAIPLTVWLASQRSSLRVPKGFVIYAMFVGWMLVSVIRIDTPSRYLAFGLRALTYIAAGGLILFAVNAPRGLDRRRIAQGLAMLWLIVIAGGWLGILMPNLSFLGPVAAFVPDELVVNPFIVELLSVGTADVSDFIGFQIPRPRAPFTYTNQWGSTVGLLVPLALGTIRTDIGIPRWLLAASVAAAIPPILFSLNRGLWLSIGVTLGYGAFRLAAAGRSNALIAGGSIALATLLVAILTPLGGLFVSRINTGHSDAGRQSLYSETVERTLEAPLLGHGAPRPSSQEFQPSLGTHGMAWYTMFSHGFVGFGLYLGFFLLVVFHTRSPSTEIGFAAHTTVVVGLAQMPFYGQFSAPLCIMGLAAGLAYLDSHRPAQIADAGSLPPAPAPPAPPPLTQRSERFVPLERGPVVQSRGPSSAGLITPSAGAPPATGPNHDTPRPAGDGQPPDLTLPNVDAGAATIGAGPRTDRADWTWDRVAQLSGFLWSPQSGIRLVRNPGSTPVRAVYLAHPNAVQPEVIVPAHRLAGSRAVYRPSDGTPLKRRLGMAGSAAAIRLGTGRLPGRRLYVTGGNELSALRPDEALAAHVAELLDEPELMPAMTVGPDRRIRKPVVGFHRPDGTIAAYAKVAVDDLTRRLVANEAAWLDLVGRESPREFQAPTLLARTTWRDHGGVVMTPVPVTFRRHRSPLSLPEPAILSEIARIAGSHTERLADSTFIVRHRRLAAKDPGLLNLIDGVVGRVGSVALEMGSWHGDLGPWNVATTDDSTGVIDWEFAGLDVPVGIDAYNAAVQIHAVRQGAHPRQALALARDAGRWALPELGVHGDREFATWLCYLLELIARCELLADPSRVDHLELLQAEALAELQLVIARG